MRGKAQRQKTHGNINHTRGMRRWDTNGRSEKRKRSKEWVDAPTVAKVLNTFTYDTLQDLTVYTISKLKKRKLNTNFAEELVQTAIMQLYRGKQRCRKDLCTGKDGETLYAIVKCCTRRSIRMRINNLIDRLRRRPDETAHSLDQQNDGDDGFAYDEDFIYTLTKDSDLLFSTRADAPVDEIHTQQLFDMIRERFGEETIRILELYMDENDYSVEEIAESLGVRTGRIYELLRNVRAWLKWDARAPFVRRDFDEQGTQILELHFDEGKRAKKSRMH